MTTFVLKRLLELSFTLVHIWFYLFIFTELLGDYSLYRSVFFFNYKITDFDIHFFVFLNNEIVTVYTRILFLFFHRMFRRLYRSCFFFVLRFTGYDILFFLNYEIVMVYYSIMRFISVQVYILLKHKQENTTSNRYIKRLKFPFHGNAHELTHLS